MTLPESRRLPVASYDLVVYFGVGILALPFFRVWVAEPLSLRPPEGSLLFPSFAFVGTAILTLLVLFAGYALGHVIALFSSFFVERFVQLWLGYPSDIWLSACARGVEARRQIIRDRVVSARYGGAMLIVSLFHLPLAPFYAVMWVARGFDFYFTKLPCELHPLLLKKLKAERLPVPVQHGSTWPKVLKQYVVNNCPVAYTRMSNHRVVFGLLRSLAFLAVCFLWAQIGFAAVDLWDGGAVTIHLVRWLVIGTTATLLIIGFAKFNRRFFEESVYAFLLTRSTDASSPSER